MPSHVTPRCAETAAPWGPSSPVPDSPRKVPSASVLTWMEIFR